jgi:RPA family protein
MTAFLRREVARRVFAKELMSSTHTITDGSEKSPVYVLTPLGLKCNRVFVIGVLTEKEERGEEGNIYRIRILDQTGSFVGYVGRYQPEAFEALEEIEPFTLVAVTAKVRVFEGERGKLVTLRPETISVSDPESRDYWVIETAIHTLERIRAMERGDSEMARMAMEVYNTNLEEYRKAVREAIMRLIEDYGELREEEAEEEEIEEEFEFEEEELSFEEEEIDLTELLED